MHFFAVFACAMVATIVGILPGNAEQRVALIVGNSGYRYVSRLNNPANDARLMASTLRDLGFMLIGGGALIDLDKAGLDRAVQAFGAGLRGAEVGLFYYSGHGVQVRGANYIVPIDANATREADVDFQMLDATLVLRQMEAAGTRLNIVILAGLVVRIVDGQHILARHRRSYDKGAQIEDAAHIQALVEQKHAARQSCR
jgi:Caspase domain